MPRLSTLLLSAWAVSATAIAQAPPAFPTFESPQTRSVAVSPDGTRLLAVNTPDARLLVFSLANPRRPALLAEVPVGQEPIAVAFRTPNEAWVVDHLGDAISVVDLDGLVVAATLPVGDEPGGITFAAGFAFVPVATEKRVAVFDGVTRQLVDSIDVFAEEPRYVTTSVDGQTVYVASNRSGNDTTIVPENLAPPQPAPTNPQLPAPPSVGLIVDSEDPAWTAAHGVVLPDHDVFAIDASTRTITRRVSGVGTNLFGLAEHPTDGSVWVCNTEALNLIRYEPALRGHFVDNRVTRIETVANGGAATAIDLNPQINYGVLPNASALATALAQPTDIAFAPDGSAAYVAAFGTDRIGVLDPTTGAVVARIQLGDAVGSTPAPRTKRGPRALAHHPTAAVLYVLERLSNDLAVVDTATRTLVAELPLVFDPTPDRLKTGRGFLYDAMLSGNGTGSCASCHVDATLDGVGWDLGDRGGDMVNGPGPFGIPVALHPMKGPMTTQTLQGLKDVGPLHWRGDRPTFQSFNVAFDGLLGGSQIAAGDMNDYTAFIESLVFPPNPNQNRDRTFKTSPAGVSPEDGRQFFLNTTFGRQGLRCNDCHTLPTGTNGQVIPGALLQEPQGFKVPQLRNLYKRTGRKPVNGERVSGFGILHDGTIDDVFDLLTLPVFGALASQASNKTKLEAFVESLDTGLAPTVGFARTVEQSNANDPQLGTDLALLEAQAAAGNCDLVVHGRVDGDAVGFVWRPVQGGRFVPNRGGSAVETTASLVALAAQGRATLTFGGVVPGQGTRVGIDRDGDGVLDGDAAATPYGATTPGCAQTLRANSEPFAGNELFGYVTENAAPNAAGVLVVGFGQAATPFLGVTVLVDLTNAATAPLVTDSTGTAVTALPIPTGSNGASLFAQALFVTGCGRQGIGATNGVALTVP